MYGHDDADEESGDSGDSDNKGMGYMAPEDIEYEMIQTENERINCDSYDIEHNVMLQEDGWNEKGLLSGKKLIEEPDTDGWFPPFKSPFYLNRLIILDDHIHSIICQSTQRKSTKGNIVCLLVPLPYRRMKHMVLTMLDSRNFIIMDGNWRTFLRKQIWYTINCIEKCPVKNMFPKEEHDGSLDAGLLKKIMGLARECMICGDALFSTNSFFQSVIQ